MSTFAWIEDVPDPLVLVLCLVADGAVLAFGLTRGDRRMDDELRADGPHQTTGRVLAALPAPITRLLFVGIALLLAAYGVSRVA